MDRRPPSLTQVIASLKSQFKTEQNIASNNNKDIFFKVSGPQFGTRLVQRNGKTSIMYSWYSSSSNRELLEEEEPHESIREVKGNEKMMTAPQTLYIRMYLCSSDTCVSYTCVSKMLCHKKLVYKFRNLEFEICTYLPDLWC